MTKHSCGHRQVAMCLRAELGVGVADKTVLKLMREIGLRCGIRRRRGYRAYSSYMGRVGETFENLLGRDFSASRPWEKLARDRRHRVRPVQPWGKAYLAPVLDLCGNRVVSWSISLSPNMEQQDEMLAGLWAEITRLRRDEYSGDLQRHYAGVMPIWVLLELSSFGTVADVYRFCADRWGDRPMLREHYFLRSAKGVRNACAHSSAIINGFGAASHVARPAPAALTVALRDAGFTKRSRASRMRNQRLQQIASLLLLHRRMAEGTALAGEASAELRYLADDIRSVLSVTRPDASAEAYMEFPAGLVDRWFLSGIV